MNSNVKEKGVVFTPKEICEYMISFIDEGIENILEPSCGEGIFIKCMKEKGMKNITGNDINGEFIKKCKEEYPDITFYNEDFVEYDKNKKYDVIIGNPPYVRIQNLKDETLSKIRKEYEIISGNLDIYIYFIMKCIEMLSDNGKLIFIVPNSFLYNKSCKKVREKLMGDGLLEYVIDFKEKKMFDGYSVYTCILVFNKRHSAKRMYYLYANNMKGEYEKRMYNEYKVNDSLLKYINIKNGIATLSDDVYIIKEIEKEDDKYIYFRKKYKVEKDIVKRILKVSKREIYYIIYPYKTELGKIIAMNDLSMYPECEKYLLEYKEKLKNRDKSKKEYEKWYAYGRKQGLETSNTTRQFISNLVKDIKNNIYSENVELFYSGLVIEVKNEYKDKLSMTQLLEILKENEKKILEKANVKSNGWYALSKSCFDIEFIS
jgi:type I restriction-modification system DNA methylase subunit